MDQDPLVPLPVGKWGDLEKEFQRDWPRSIAGYWALNIQREWIQRGLEYDFKVYCPFGDVRNGMVAIANKGKSKELVIQCASDDTAKLEDALRRTRRIEWNRLYTIPCPPIHITRCIQAVLKDVNMKIRKNGTPHHLFLLDKNSPMFEDTRLPEGVTVELLREEHIPVADSTWVNKYRGSDWYFELLIKAQYGYGLFKDGQLACFVFVNDIGFLTHMFTLENFRRQGFAEILLKSLCNTLIKQKKDVYGFVMEGSNACKLYEKLGFQFHHIVLWGFIDQVTSRL